MGENSAIGWTDHTFNPWTGCTKVSEACRNCYAESWAKRTGIVKWGEGAERRRTSESYWKQPHKWNREALAAGVRRRVFCASLADVFEDRQEVKPWRKDLFDLIYATPNLDWLLLTKRPQNIPKMLRQSRAHGAECPPNVWFGTTVESDAEVKRIDSLFAVRLFASVLFLSVEPMLGPLNLLANQKYQRKYGGYRPLIDDLDWVIAGGESGPQHRALSLDHVRSLRDQCHDFRVPFFFKQHGGRTPDAGGCLLDGREYKEFPKAA